MLRLMLSRGAVQILVMLLTFCVRLFLSSYKGTASRSSSESWASWPQVVCMATFARVLSMHWKAIWPPFGCSQLCSFSRPLAQTSTRWLLPPFKVKPATCGLFIIWPFRDQSHLSASLSMVMVHEACAFPHRPYSVVVYTLLFSSRLS